MSRISADRATSRAARFAAGLRCICEILPLLGKSLCLIESDIETCRAASRAVEAALEHGDAKATAASLACAEARVRATLDEIGRRGAIDQSHLQSLRSLLVADTSTDSNGGRGAGICRSHRGLIYSRSRYIHVNNPFRRLAKYRDTTT